MQLWDPGHLGNRDLTNCTGRRSSKLIQAPAELADTAGVKWMDTRLLFPFLVYKNYVCGVYVCETTAMFTYCMCVDTQPITTCGDQRKNCKNWFFPSTMRVPHIKARPRGSANTFTHWACIRLLLSNYWLSLFWVKAYRQLIWPFSSLLTGY